MGVGEGEENMHTYGEFLLLIFYIYSGSGGGVKY